jgi:uncharacterized cupredoxin-like copper-binding protein
MSALTALPRRAVLTAAAAVLALSGVSAAGIAAASDGFGHHRASAAGCTVPALPGAVVDVSQADMRSMMGGGSMMGGNRGLLSQNDWPRFSHGMMTVNATPTTVAAGVVSLRVANTGYLTHELVVLPLADGQQPGQRPVGADGKVAETGSLGEASATCAAESGEGIAASSSGWVSRTLTTGRYELLCNLPGHYAGGMWTEFDVR